MLENVIQLYFCGPSGVCTENVWITVPSLQEHTVAGVPGRGGANVPEPVGWVSVHKKESVTHQGERHSIHLFNYAQVY